MPKQENLGNPEDDSEETPEQKQMSDELKNMAESVENNPSRNGELTKEKEGKLSPEEWELAEALKFLGEEKNQMAIRVLCAGYGKERGEFSMKNISFRLLGGKGQNLEDMQFQLEIKGGTHVYNFPSWGGNLDGLAVDLLKEGITAEDLENMIDNIEGTADRIEQQDSKWVITEYGPNNDKTITFEEFLGQ